MCLLLYEYASARPDDPLPACIRREGWAMLAALTADARQLAGVTARTFAVAPDGDDETALAAQAREVDGCVLIAPEFDDLLLRRAVAVQTAGGRLLSCGPEAITLAADKLRCHELWQAAGVPTPSTWPGSAEPLRPPPWVRKWRRGAGSQEMQLLCEAGPLPPDRDWLLQEYCAGLPASASFLCGPDGYRQPLLPGLQHLSSDGRFQYLGGSLPLPEPLRTRASVLGAAALAALPAKDWCGFVGVDLILGADARGTEDRVIEVNARLTSSYLGLRQQTSGNLLDLWLRIAAGEAPPAPRWYSRTLDFSADGSWQLRETPPAQP